eukprot:c1864_g1_i2.p2 GENE.c1864_g1_i2~~c1864_g1_i2.p2  ORF type:complete len:166 (+),score=33.15 c1864_g1_i2:847-1344(+)
MHTLCGTREFVAPEMLGFEGYGPEVDVWACGVILYVLLSGSLPFFDPVELKLYQKILSCSYTFPSEPWSRISKDAKDLISNLLVHDPKERYTPTEALNHRWMQQIDSVDGEAFPGRLQQYQRELALTSHRHWRQFTNTVSAVRTLQEFAQLLTTKRLSSPPTSPR